MTPRRAPADRLRTRVPRHRLVALPPQGRALLTTSRVVVFRYSVDVEPTVAVGVGVEEDGQGGGCAEGQAGDVHVVGGGVEAQAGQPVEQRVQDDRVSMRARCMPRQMCAPNANAMCCCGSRKMSNRSGSSQRLSSWFAAPSRRSRMAPGRDAARRRARRRAIAGAHDAGERRLPAQALLDRLRHQRAVVAHRVELVGMREQPEEQVARRAVGGLGAGREQQAQEGEDLLVGEALAVELGAARAR